MGRCQQSNPTSIVGQHWNALPTSLNELEFYDHHRRRNSTGIEILVQFALFKRGIGAKDKWRPQKSSCKKGKKNTPIQNQISTWKMKSVFSLSLFLFATLKLIAGQLPVEAYNEIIGALQQGVVKIRWVRNLVPNVHHFMLLFRPLRSGMLEIRTLPTNMENAIHCEHPTFFPKAECKKNAEITVKNLVLE